MERKYYVPKQSTVAQVLAELAAQGVPTASARKLCNTPGWLLNENLEFLESSARDSCPGGSGTDDTSSGGEDAFEDDGRPGKSRSRSQNSGFTVLSRHPW